ncbi:hypothetical protein EDB80DRAFT_85061 [Ilyonectria destructans]|nr:hypothetical protein EDB80DRAFT_85061 [Ilyonectria destructans]
MFRMIDLRKRPRHDETTEISLPTVNAETAIRECKLYQEPYPPIWPCNYSTPSNMQNYQSSPEAADLRFIGDWSTQSVTNPTFTASPNLDFSTFPSGPSNKKPRLPSSVKRKRHDLQPKKRSRHSPPPTSHPNLARSQSFGSKQLKQQSDPTKTPALLACPFYKSNRHKHHDCLKYELRRVKDVKQHIYRKHVQPEFYCSRCFRLFSTFEEKFDHDVHEPLCEGQRPQKFDGISEQQRQDLNCSTSRGRSMEEQWFSTWDILFPGQTRPQSCYLGNYLNEVMSQIRDFWDRKRDAILPDVLDDTHVNVVNPGLLNDMMGKIFDRFQSEMSIPATEMNTTPLVPEHTSQKPIEMPDTMTKELSQEIHPTNAGQDSQEDSQLESIFMETDQVKFDNEDGFLSEWELLHFGFSSPPTSST